ncbi:MAG: AMP-binding protein [Desulfatibacillum sp.]|nr:AMP-binding protein [Desulfatibacillum sp.]
MPPYLDHNNRLNLASLFSANQDRPALAAGSQILTYGDVQNGLERVVHNLERPGVQKNHVLAIHAPNSVDHIFLFLASWVMGFTYAALDPKGPPGKVLAGLQPDYIVTPGDPAPWKGRVISPDSLHEQAGKSIHFMDSIPLSQECSVIFTSGTTGEPKGVAHTVGAFYYSAMGTVEYFSLTPDDKWLVSLPLFHVGGMLIFIRTLLCGGMSIVHGDPGDLAPAISKWRPTVLSLVPTQLQRLMDIPEMNAPLAACKAILLGGAPCPGPLIEKALDAGVPIAPTYGSTEACAMVTAVKPESLRQEYFTAGRVLPYREVTLDRDGCVILGGETLFKHYIADGQVEEALKNGKFRTSDLGEWDSKGNLKILGRRDLVFISGGENINPLEIEKALVETGLVQEAVVAPVDDAVFGQVPWAFVLTQGPLDELKIRAALKKILPPYKVPKRILPLKASMGGKGVKRDRKALEKIARAMAQSL